MSRMFLAFAIIVGLGFVSMVGCSDTTPVNTAGTSTPAGPPPTGGDKTMTTSAPE